MRSPHLVMLSLLLLGPVSAADFGASLLLDEIGSSTTADFGSGAGYAAMYTIELIGGLLPHNPYVCVGGGVGTVDTCIGEVGVEGLFSNFSLVHQRRSGSGDDRNQYLVGFGPGYLNIIQLQYLRANNGAEGARIQTNIPFLYMGRRPWTHRETMQRNWPFHDLFIHETGGAVWSRLFVQRLTHLGVKETQVGLEFGVSLY